MEADRQPVGDALARYYDLDLAGASDDVDFYLALAGRGGQNVVELGCGTGRLAIPMAQAGNAVVGVDHDPHMLARARTAWAAAGGPVGSSLELLEADMLTLDLPRRFDLVILGLNMLVALAGREAQAAALGVAARHLAPPGRLTLDVSLPGPAELASWDGGLDLAWQRADPETGDTVAKLWSAEYDHVGGVATVTTYFDAWPSDGGSVRRVARRDELHLLSATELRALVGQAGLRVEQAGGDYALSPLDAGSERAVLVCSLL
jgi:SAM-dependent methyltransferase